MKEEKKAPELAGDVIAEIKLGGVKLDILRSITATVAQFHDKHGTRTLTAAQVRTAYRALTADHRDGVDLKKAQAVIVGHLQQMWYETVDAPLPAFCVEAQDQRLKEAKESEVTMSTTSNGNGGTKPAKEKRATVGALIRGELQRNFSDEVIIKNIHEKFPKSKAGKADIAYYRSQLRNEGLIPKFVRAAKTATVKKTSGKKTGTKKKAGGKKKGGAASK